MISGWGKLSILHAGIASILIGLLAVGEPNMFTFPVMIAFVTASIYCAVQWSVNRTIKRLEAEYGK